MGKKFIKNALLMFVILYTVLSIGLYIYNVVYTGSRWKDFNEKIANKDYAYWVDMEEALSNSIKNQYGEESPAIIIMPEYYRILTSISFLQLEIIVIIASIAFSIAISVIITFKENSKNKELLWFFSIGICVDVIYTIIQNNFYFTDIGDFMNYFIMNVFRYGIFYIIIYVIIFAIRYNINKKYTKKLNEELKSRQGR